MQIVIDIPEVYFEALKKADEIVSGQRSGKTLMSVVYNAVANGTPLPKGHGDLVDRDAINSRYYGIYTELESLSNKPLYKELLDKLSMCLDTAKTIIEADKED